MVADEMAIRVGGEQLWNWNVMDAKTRYILASHLSRTRTTRDAETLFKKARANALSDPVEIKTDRLKAYDDGIEGGSSVPEYPLSNGRDQRRSQQE